HSYGIHVLLDPHQDAVGSATCGFGVPQWFSKLATPDEIGKPLQTSALWHLAGKNLKAFPNGTCGSEDTETWSLFAGADDYNLRNPCCLLNNADGWQQLEFTEQAQATWHYLFDEEGGRRHYVAFIRLLARAVRARPAAFGIELYNEPFDINAEAMFKTWQECYQAIQEEVPGMLVGIVDVGEGANSWWQTLITPWRAYWLRRQDYLFFAFHWYGMPSSPTDAIKHVGDYSWLWKMPALLTEFSDCGMQELTEKAGIGWLYWHYSQYCDTAPSPQCGHGKSDCSFGACITGWGSGNSSRQCHPGLSTSQSSLTI
ncbi:unnamed protein product, partial [Polarella glacialis]